MGIKRLKNLIKRQAKSGGSLYVATRARSKETLQRNTAIEQAGATSAAAASAAAARTAEEQAALDAENTYRSGLSGNKSGLASTILNLGGAAGDPTKPLASGLLSGGRALDEGSLTDAASPLDDPITRLKRKRQAGL